jgi:DNA-binding transcriptional LysR family regulator
MHFSLTDLHLFVQIAERQNVTKGAQRASLSPAAASERLKSLEEQLGTRLFYREPRGVRLTPAGELLLRHARVILRQVEHAKSEFSLYSADSTGHIRVFANTTAVTEFMPGLLARFMVERPGVTVDLQERTTNEVVRGILDYAADIGIVAGPVPTEGLEALCFSRDRLVLVTAENHPLSTKSAIAFADALDYDHIGMDEGSTLHTFLVETVKNMGRKLTLRVQMRSFEAMCRMIEAGVGVGILPQSAARHHQKTMRLNIIQLADSWSIRERRVLVREMEALPTCARALVSDLMALGEPERHPMSTLSRKA